MIRYNKIHIHKNEYRRNYKLVLLMIPIFIFAIALAIFSTYLPERKVAWSGENSAVLGVENQIK